jgi:GAF domain-containing protein
MAQTPTTLAAFLAEIVGLAAGVVTPAATCGLTVRRNRQPLTVASSDARAAQIDEFQYEIGEGPCLDALDTDQTILVDDFDDDRWPRFRTHALPHGVASSLSIPLVVEGQQLPP